MRLFRYALVAFVLGVVVGVIALNLLMHEDYRPIIPVLCDGGEHELYWMWN